MFVRKFRRNNLAPSSVCLNWIHVAVCCNNP